MGGSGEIGLNVEVFKSGDEPFFEWAKKNPEGFILNTAAGSGSRYLIFHRSGCQHISGYTNRYKTGAFTTRGYIKVCSNDPSELIEWAGHNRPTVTAYESCKSCKPDIESTSPALAEEVADSGKYTEGATRVISINAYERNPLARKACLAYYGYACVVCGFNFEEQFGAFAEGFIHVHHLVPLSEVGVTYEVDPIKDLRPVCPNCHAAIHLGGVTRSIEELRRLMKAAQQGAAADVKTATRFSRG